MRTQLRRSSALPATSIVLVLICLPVTTDLAAQPLALQASTLSIAAYEFDVRLPAGWTVEFLTPLESPRLIHVVGDTLLIGSRAGKLYRLDRPYTAPQSLMMLEGYPHSVVVHDETLYIARTDRVDSVSWSVDVERIDPDDLRQLVALPGGRGHDSRTLKLGPDKQLYVSLGIAGNCSDQYLDDDYPVDDRRGGVFRIERRAAGARLVPYASGLRNPVGFDWHPGSGAMHASNNGPDHLGYEQPPEAIARLEQGSFHGMPWFQFDGEALFRDDCIDTDPPRPVTEVSMPVATLPARSAPMDLMFPGHASADALDGAGLQGDALLAVRGSWASADGSGGGDPASRREPRIAHIEFDDGAAVAVHDFMTGFQLADGRRWARPVGLASGPDGSIYFTSDEGITGLYRLTYEP